MLSRTIPLLIAAAFAIAPSAATPQQADLILTGARIWTGDPDRAWAEAVAIDAGRILAVGEDDSVRVHAGANTRMLELAGRFVSPGFIDNHTHFNRAGELILGVNLLDVADEAALVRRVREAQDRLPAGAWMVGGDWGAYEAWALASTGGEDAGHAAEGQFRPHRSMIDSITPSTPVLLSRWDGSVYAYAANEEAIKGSVTPGKLADLVVLDRDPFQVPPSELKDLKVVLTMVGGDIVYDARKSPLSRTEVRQGH